MKAQGTRIIERLMITLLMALSFGTMAQDIDVEIDEITDLTYNPGRLVMYAYKPASAGMNAPMVVLLHGCMQDAKSFAVNTGWKAKADKLGVILLMPQQTKLNNGVNCFTWYERSDVTRDKGEVASIASMIDYMQQKYAIDTSRVFVTGISAGGTMSAALMASYPEKVTAGAIVSGVSYGCAFSLLNSYTCMFAPTSTSAQNRGDDIREAGGNYRGRYPTVMVVHGTSDSIVNSSNAGHSVEQWLNVHGIDDQADEVVDLADDFTLDSFQDDRSQARVESIVLRGKGHGWPINTAVGCGHTGQFYLNGELCLTDILAKRWGLE